MNQVLSDTSLINESLVVPTSQSINHVLIVDDEASNRKLLKALLTREGCLCSCACDAEEALTLMAQELPDVMLVDVMMPGMDGFELTKSIKSQPDTKHIPIVLITALTDRESMLTGLKAGAEDFLHKPIDSVELIIRVRNLFKIKQHNDLLLHHNEILERTVAKRTAEIRETQMSIIRCLGRAVEFRDNETGNHIIRMSRYSALIAESYGLNEFQCSLILQASSMHDVGKVAIPDSILLKPGPFTADERKVMQTHTIIGERILIDENEHENELMDVARRVALSHHERWDGSGYPNGLSQDSIPIEARIVAVADVYDALTSPRPYKVAWTNEDAIQEILSLRNLAFDPAVVDAFLQALPAINKVKQQYPDR